MKKNVMIAAAIAVMAMATVACSKSEKQNDTEVVVSETGVEEMDVVSNNGTDTATIGEVVGEEVVMPQEGTDTNVIANGTAIADTPVK
ncbi:MAG: hypothetical protein NC217_02940 [Muribaculaceae bacterium]|nr:hypothetical protein [Muribaculaceae bacterium]